MRKCIIYARVSTSKQSDGMSLEAQTQRCRDWVSLRGHEVCAEFQDVSSGAKSDREGFIAALERTVKEKGILVCYSLSRLSRSTIKCIELVQMLGKKGCSFVSIVDGELNSDTPQSHFMLGIFSSLCEMERKMTSQRTKMGLAYLKSQGHRISHRIPYGFDLDPQNPKKLLRNDQEQQVIARILDLSQSGKSLGEIAQLLNDEKIPTKQGCRWGRGTLHSLIKRERAALVAA